MDSALRLRKESFGMKEYKISKEWLGPYDDAPDCIYNKCVGCDSKQCESCGWNPFVSLERMISKYGEAAASCLTLPRG